MARIEIDADLLDIVDRLRYWDGGTLTLTVHVLMVRGLKTLLVQPSTATCLKRTIQAFLETHQADTMVRRSQQMQPYSVEWDVL